MINIGTDRELFWDNYIVDTDKTTAQSRLGHMTNKGVVLRHDAPWEGDGCNYHSLFYDKEYKGGMFRMYYSGWSMISPDNSKHTVGDGCFAYAESKDGSHWDKPVLNLCERNGSKENNIVVTKETFELPHVDNFFVFADDNPNRQVKERYKAVMSFMENSVLEQKGRLCLMSLVSDDGFNWRVHKPVTYNGKFDTLNTCHWNEKLGKYFCFIRDFHFPDGRNPEPGEKVDDLNALIRDIKVLESPDFINWTEAKQLSYGDAEDVPLYTNVITPYYRAPQVMTGFPTRYIERHEWTKNFDRLCGAEKRQIRCKLHPRYGLTVTDCVFMCSRDGYNWLRPDEAFMRPEPEDGRNWVYGDCYPAVGMIETKSDIEGADDEISMFVYENHWMGIPAILYRYTIRKDGFMSRHAGIKPEKIVTREFAFEGSTMLLNFATSARGYLYITIRDVESGRELHSGELFGNRTDRIVDFDGEISELAGKKVVMEMELCDGDVYAFKFE